MSALGDLYSVEFDVSFAASFVLLAVFCDILCFVEDATKFDPKKQFFYMLVQTKIVQMSTIL